MSAIKNNTDKVIDFKTKLIAKKTEAESLFDEVKDLDNIAKKHHNEHMNTVTIELLDAKLEAAEARTEARVARLEALVEGSIKNSENSVARIEQTTKEIKQEYKETKAEISKSKKDLIMWGIGIAITSILAIWAINSSLISAVQSSYGIGMTTKDNIQAEVSAQTKGINEKLNKLIELQQKQLPKQ